MSEHTEMRSIWFFVGLLLLSTGTLIVISGIMQLIHPPAVAKVLARLHPALWWGAVMVGFGVIFLLVEKRRR